MTQTTHDTLLSGRGGESRNSVLHPAHVAGVGMDKERGNLWSIGFRGTIYERLPGQGEGIEFAKASWIAWAIDRFVGNGRKTGWLD